MPRSPPSPDPGELPLPSADARAHSEKVVAHIASSIVEAGGWISVADYMGAFGSFVPPLTRMLSEKSTSQDLTTDIPDDVR